MHISPILLDSTLRAALAEDLGSAGDVTSHAVIPANAVFNGQLVAREAGIICGIEIAQRVFQILDSHIQFQPHISDGTQVPFNTPLATITGPARSILAGERVALNFLGHLSGIATSTHQYSDLIRHTKARVTCTRKTTPGLRAYEKYAVKCGGGSNHRYNLDDAILIKDNHIAVAGGIRPALLAAQKSAGHLMPIEIEVDTLAQLDEALACGAKIILLDNMAPEMLLEAVRITNGRAVLEASGGVNLNTIQAIAETGVDYISIGKLTTSVTQLDIGLDV